jgi:rod shape-determining protein MreD
MGDRRPKIEQRIATEIIWAVVLMSLALFETSLAPSVWRFRIDWVLLFGISWTLLYGLTSGVRVAFYGGLALDILGSSAVGTHFLALLLCVIAVALVSEPLDRDQTPLVVAAMLGAALLYTAVLVLVLYVEGNDMPWRSYLLVELIPTALINTLVALPIWAILHRLYQRRQPAASAEFT